MEPGTEHSRQSTPPKQFEIVHSREQQTVRGHAAAARAAKGLSSRLHGRVTVEREDGRVHMQYRDGELLTYLYETRERAGRG